MYDNFPNILRECAVYHFLFRPTYPPLTPNIYHYGAKWRDYLSLVQAMFMARVFMFRDNVAVDAQHFVNSLEWSPVMGTCLISCVPVMMVMSAIIAPLLRVRKGSEC